MKMTDEHFSELATRVRAFIVQYPLMIPQYKDAFGFSMTRFAWDVFHNVDHYVETVTGEKRMFSSLLYEYLNDSHIETALKRIVKSAW